MSDWQKIADTITREYFGSTERYNFTKMLSETEANVRPLIQDEDPLKRHVYLVPLDDGGIVEVDYHPTFTQVSEYDREMKKSPVISGKSSERGEIAPVRNFSAKLKKEKRGIGYPYPEALQNMFRSLRKGEYFVFENGVSFICTEKKGNIVTLKKFCGNITGDSDISALLSEGKEFDVDPASSSEMQALYRMIYDRHTDSARGRIASMAVVKDYVNALIGGAEKGCDKRIDVGPIMMRLKKPFMQPAKVYNAENHVVDNETLYRLYAWMRNAPVIINFIHSKESDVHAFDDTRFSERIEQFFKDGKFDNVYNSICEYVLRLNGEMKVEIKTYIRNEDDFFADGFLFSFENDAVIMRRATYSDNDIMHKIVALKKSPQRLFVDFCAEKYNSDYFLMKNNKRAVLRKSLPQSKYIIE